MKIIKKKSKGLIQRNTYTNIKTFNKYNKNLYYDKFFCIFFVFLFFLVLLLMFFIYHKNIKFNSYQSNKIASLNNNNSLNILINNSNLDTKHLSLFFENRINDLRRNSIIYPLPGEIKFIPLMTIDDLKAFSYFMKPENIYFEFGSGGSTNLASFYRLKQIYSVESDVNWHNKLKNNFPNVIYITIDLKANGNFGYPGQGTNVEDWKKYIQAYKSEYNADIIMIDGRFRVACGLDIFSKIRNNTLVLVHDYENRDNFHVLENYYIKVRKWETLSAFFKNPNIKTIPKEVYDKYIYIAQ